MRQVTNRRRKERPARGSTRELRDGIHLSLLVEYRLHLSRELARLMEQGRSLKDLVAILVRTSGDDDLSAVVSRADALEIAQVAGLESELLEPPPPGQLHVFTFAHLTGCVRTVLVRPMSEGGDA